MAKNIIIHPSDQWACGYYRVIQRAMVWNAFFKEKHGSEARLAESYLNEDALIKENAGVCYIQRQFHDNQISSIELYKRLGMTVLNDCDDMLWQVPPTNPFAKAFNGNVRKNLKRSIEIADIQTVSTIPLQEEVKKFAKKDSIILPNMLEPDWFNQPKPRTSDTLTVLWAGSSTHHDDLGGISKVIHELKDENIHFIFFGALPSSVSENTPNITFIKGVDFKLYKSTIHSLLDTVNVAVTPLHPCRFNDCKSNLKLLEMGAVGLPVISSNIYPYKDAIRKVDWGNKQNRDWSDLLMGYARNESLRMSDAWASYKYAEKFKLDTEENKKLVENLFCNLI